MLGFPSEEEVDRLREKYPKGTRIQLGYMKDDYSPLTPGSEGTVTHVDDAGQIHMAWDSGSSLALIPGEDVFTKIE